MRFHPVIYLVTGLVLLAFVGADIYRWIYSTSITDSFEGARSLYLAWWPESLRNARGTTAIDISILAISIVCFMKLNAYPKYKIAGSVALIISVVLICWLLFSLM